MELPKWYDGEKYLQGGEVQNPFNDETYTLTANELAMYNLIRGAMLSKQNPLVRMGLEWFRLANTKLYMLLNMKFAVIGFCINSVIPKLREYEINSRAEFKKYLEDNEGDYPIDQVDLFEYIIADYNEEIHEHFIMEFAEKYLLESEW